MNKNENKSLSNMLSDLNENRIFNYQNFALVIVILILIIIASLISPNFLRTNNLINVLQQISVKGIVTIGAAIILISGGVDLSAGMMISFISCVCAWLYNDYGISVEVMAILGLFLSTLCGLLNGFIISRTEAEPFIITLGMMSVYQGLALLVSNGDNISLHGAFSFLGMYKIPVVDLPISVVILILIFIIFFLSLQFTRFGRRVYAIGGNVEAARLAGIDVKNYRLILYGINGFIVGIGALILLSRLGSANATVGTGIELQAIAATVVGGVSLVGGVGNVIGALLGMILLGLVSNSLNLLRIPAFFQYIFLGAIIVGSIVISSYKKE